MSVLPSIPTLEGARAACTECARGSYTYLGKCVGCQARHIARIPLTSMRRDAVEARRGDLGPRWGLFRELARQWHLDDHNRAFNQEGQHAADDSREAPVSGP